MLVAVTRNRICAVIILVAAALACPAFAAPRRHAATPPLTSEAAARWLDAHAIPLATTEAAGGLDDLAPLAGIVGDAAVVGLGDGTHGTHEFFTTKLRILQCLVERMNFDVLAVEGSFPQFERLNAWILGGDGELASLLRPRGGEQYFYFWDVEEFAAVATWMRNYNLARGSKPPIEILGADVYDGYSAGMLVVDYLKSVDAAAADRAMGAYVCTRGAATADCRLGAAMVAQELSAKEAEYTTRSSARRFADAAHAAAVVTQSFTPYDEQRDPAMAANVSWARANRSVSKRVVYWAHAEHVTKHLSAVEHNVAAGEWLARELGSGYVAFGNATWSGRFRIPGGTAAFPDAGDDAYESFFHAAGAAAMIVPLRGAVHPYLAAPHHHRGAGAGAPAWDVVVDLRRKFDAILYVDQTTPTRPLP